MPFLTNMSSVGDSDKIYMFGGYNWPKYDPFKQNMYESCPPYTTHNKRPKQESVFIVLDLSKMEIECTHSPTEFATADGSLQVLSKDQTGYLENLLIVGGTGQRIDLYSTFDFEVKHCDINPEYGGCIVTLASRNKESLACSAPECDRVVHKVCDKYTRGLTKIDSHTYKCPLCANYDPVTKKKRSKSTGRRGGRQSGGI